MSENIEIKPYLSNLLRARFPVIYVETWEENRILKIISEIANNQDLIKTTRNLYVWSINKGLYNAATNKKVEDAEITLDSSLTYFEALEENAILVLKDIHSFFNSVGIKDSRFIRSLRDAAEFLKTSKFKKNIIITSPVLEIPIELSKDITVVEFPLPSFSELRELLEKTIQTNSKFCPIELNEEEKDKIAKTAQGLTLSEAENAFARALVERKRLTINELDIIVSEKCQVIKKTGILEFIPSNMSIDDVGGLENLKKWLLKRKNSWSDKAQKDYNLSAPKGILITGIPGCGKSLTAKAMSSFWNIPLLRLDVGKIFNKYIGNSEENIRKAIQTAEAVAPSILWIDEIEKGFSTNDGDSGTSQRILGTFLTWMQEKKKPVFVIATANNIDKLPPELMRKGRFDEIFFVDLPTKHEREVIFRLHLNKMLKNSISENTFNLTDELISKLAEKTEGFVGAEIEQIVVAAVFEAFAEDRTLQEGDLFNAINNTVPLSSTQAEQILRIREWAAERAVAATTKEDMDGYSQIVNTNKKVDNNSDVNSSRGGRNIDF